MQYFICYQCSFCLCFTFDMVSRYLHCVGFLGWLHICKVLPLSNPRSQEFPEMPLQALKPTAPILSCSYPSFLFLISPFGIVFFKWSLTKVFVCCDNLTFVIISFKFCENKIKILKFCSSYLILVAPRLVPVSRKAELLHLFLCWKACLREGVKKDLGKRKDQAPIVTVFTAQRQSQYCLNQKSTLQS